MLKFNNNFNEPLRGHIIESATRVVNYRQYLYKNETLIDFLELDYEICERLGLQSIYKVLDKRERNKENYKKKLKSEGKMSKKEELEQIREKIKTLRAKGFLNKEISEQLDIPIKSLERHITYMRKNGLL